jgi:hypothetical protein
MAFGFGDTGETPVWMRWGVVVLALVIVVVAVLMLAGIRIGDVVGSPEGPKELVFWRSFDPVIPLRVKAADVKNVKDFGRYSMMVDMIWVNTRVVSAAPDKYRHILHRGSGEAGDYFNAMQSISTVTPSGTPTSDEILTRMPQGLPIRMNPGIMADPVTNDMLIFVDTVRDNRQMRESLRIPDIPMGQPFSLAVIVMGTMVEVYINCRLEVTKLLEGTPREVEAAWYGLAGPRPLNAALQNLRIFNGPLNTGQITAYCKKRPAFNESVLSKCAEGNE